MPSRSPSFEQGESAFIFRYACPLEGCGFEHDFHMLLVDGEWDIAGPSMCSQCGKPFSHEKVATLALQQL